MDEARERIEKELDSVMDRLRQLGGVVVAEALERLRKSRYGICEECADAISPARLKAMPEVTTCLRCQDRLEPLTAGRPFPPSATP